MACLRNPHGQGSYKGRGCDGSTICNGREGETLPKCLKFCDHSGRIIWKQDSSECHSVFALKDCNHDNGIFFMPFETFIECFPITTLVGPIDSDSKVHTVADVDNDAFIQTAGKEYVYEVHRGNLQQFYEIIAS